MTKKSKKVRQDVARSANKIWLAGLGALSVAEQEGGKLFNSLVEKGEGFEKRGKKGLEKVQNTVEDSVEVAREKADKALGKFGKGFDTRVAETLNKLGVPSRMEIQKLTRRVEQLTKKVDATNKKPTARTTKKTTTRSTAAKA